MAIIIVVDRSQKRRSPGGRAPKAHHVTWLRTGSWMGVLRLRNIVGASPLLTLVLRRHTGSKKPYHSVDAASEAYHIIGSTSSWAGTCRLLNIVAGSLLDLDLPRRMGGEKLCDSWGAVNVASEAHHILWRTGSWAGTCRLLSVVASSLLNLDSRRRTSGKKLCDLCDAIDVIVSNAHHSIRRTGSKISPRWLLNVVAGRLLKFELRGSTDGKKPIDMCSAVNVIVSNAHHIIKRTGSREGAR
jgi:hypothetical protein